MEQQERSRNNNNAIQFVVSSFLTRCYSMQSTRMRNNTRIGLTEAIIIITVRDFQDRNEGNVFVFLAVNTNCIILSDIIQLRRYFDKAVCYFYISRGIIKS